MTEPADTSNSAGERADSLEDVSGMQSIALSRHRPRVLAGMLPRPRVSGASRPRVLRRAPPWPSIFAPVLTREHAHDDDEAGERDEHDNAHRQPGVAPPGHDRTIRRVDAVRVSRANGSCRDREAPVSRVPVAGPQWCSSKTSVRPAPWSDVVPATAAPAGLWASCSRMGRARRVRRATRAATARSPAATMRAVL